jgi:UDP-glucose 4-epimerase
MRYLITGGAGFLGSHLVEALLARGDEVVVVDDCSGGSPANLPPGPRLVRAAVEDLARARSLDELAAAADRIVHLAAIVGPRRVVAATRACIERNHAAAAAILHSAARTGRPILIASSSEVYGRAPGLPFHEDADLQLGAPLEPRWAYATGKALIECLALALAREQGLRVVIARIFNTVGPRQNDAYGLVLPTFARQALRGEPITIHGDGSQTRCFTHVADTVEALRLLLDAPPAYGRIVNVGSDEEVTIAAVAERIRALARSSSPLVRLPPAEAEPFGYVDLPRRRPDLARLVTLTGFRPATPLARILGDVLDDQLGRLQTVASAARTASR